ncbi:MAG: tyrosinase family protein [Pseudomonadota bacterium]
MGTRRNILDNATDSANFIAGVHALKREDTGILSTQLGIEAGPRADVRSLSTWDLFVIWHVWTMSETSVDGQRNAAHMGPVFLPWHRWYLLLLEWQIQRVLGLSQDDFGLPYWDWAANGGDLTRTQQRRTAPIWGVIGGNGSGVDREVQDGPFTVTDFVVNVEQGPSQSLRATNRGLRRNFAAEGATRLPRTAEVESVLDEPVYDRAPWTASSLDSFRNRCEGWRQPALSLHNRVHVWVGGDMGPGSSPNDPVFFLNHCNVDRIWDAWQHRHPASGYLPAGRSAPDDPLFRHRELDPIHSILTQGAPRISDMLDVSAFYTYA